MRAIAKKIEFSPTLIYQHFRDKEALIHELCYADFRKLALELKVTQRIAGLRDSLGSNRHHVPEPQPADVRDES
ncbi:MAG: helix-turn-helix domain-containing protein [Terracidiphilus sp.]|jgi:AcrR family transcriptional regulator